MSNYYDFTFFDLFKGNPYLFTTLMNQIKKYEKLLRNTELY